ncbi:uncharacterized protein IUM83_19983 [Phytophthora cinnamomi]|uniref:uncharacterized protein n=1 Tax=Phytophthora cinnamomi TaxID=4785 RepID=UPI003559FB1A|nr:hypothetical protein IUM83_19983 [Phytophthora cinnamomi]
MSFAAKTTINNLAENLGLLLGLRACQRFGWAPLHVSHRLADKLNVLSLQHHERNYNKMADFLANTAMDSKRSVQQRPSRMLGGNAA